MKSQDNRLHTVHLIDSIYYGQLNSSYQKDSFGIQQTFDFDTYMGYWKNNKTQGLGLVILSNGTIIYAYFNRGVIDGLTIIDDGDVIVCGIYRNNQIVGVGFEYNYALKLWKMNRYHKGISIQVIKEEYSDLGNGLPKMINVEQSIYYHLYAFVYKQFFPDLGIPISTQVEPGIFCYGLLKDEKNITGPGVYIQDHQIVEAGFYEDNLLHGFGIKSRKNPFSYQFGCYHKGRKDGAFLEKDQSQTRYMQYRKGILLKNLPSSQATLLKNQKKYNFNCKDFLSAKNNVPFDEFRQNCQKPEIKNYRQKKNELSEKQKQKNKSASPNKLSPNKSQLKNSKQQSSNRSYIVGEQKQRSSVQIIREKMGNFYGIVSGRKRSKQSSPKKSPTKGGEINNYQNEEIAKEENPFY